MTPTTQLASAVVLRILVSEDEVADLVAVNPNMSNAYDLNVMRVNGSGCTTGYTTGGQYINCSISTYGSNPNYNYYCEFYTSSFSVFYPTSTILDGALSVEYFENTLGLSLKY